MKYVNVQKGLSFLVWAVVLILLGSCMTFLSVLWSGLAWIGIGFVLTGSVLELVGFIVAGKDDTNHFRQSKYMVIANIFLYVLAVILGAIPNEICQRIAAAIYNATPVFDMLVIIEVVMGCKEVSPRTVLTREVNTLLISVITLTVLQILTNDFSAYITNMFDGNGAVQIWSTVIVVCGIILELFVDVTFLFVVLNTREGLRRSRKAE